jgi:Zn-dependent protease/CBS domain-containing protein
MRIRGIEVRIDWSLAIVFWLIALNLGAGLFPRAHPDWTPLQSWLVAIAAAVLFFLSILAHELAHALVGRRQGIEVDGITLFMFGGIAHLRGEPRSAGAELKMTIVGPLTSLVIGIAATLLGMWLASVGPRDTAIGVGMIRRLGPLATILLWLGPVNIVLALFNMVPGFPLDGGRVLHAILWRATGDVATATRWASAVGRAVALLFVAAGAVMIFGGRVPLLGGGSGQGLWLVFIGWFLHSAALRSQRQVRVRAALEDVRVAELMRPGAETVPRSLSLADLAERFLSVPDQGCFPVVDGTVLVGAVCVGDLRRVPREEWARHTVAEVMAPARQLPTVGPDEELSGALEKLGTAHLDQLPVVEGDRVTGVLRLADIARWLELAPAKAP